MTSESQRPQSEGRESRAVGSGMTTGALCATLALSLWFPARLRAETIVVDDPSDSLSVVPGSCQLRDAIDSANSDLAVGGCMAGNGADRIEFSLGASNSILLSADLPAITDDLEIVGPGPNSLTIDGDDSHQVLVFEGVDGIVRGLQLFQGEGPFYSCLGVTGGSLLVEDVIVSTCTGASVSAGAFHIADVPSLVQLRRLSVEGNSGPTSAGLTVVGTEVLAEDLLIRGNHCGAGSDTCGLLIGNGSLGGAAVTLRRSTIVGNESDISPALAVAAPNSSLVLEHSTITGNRSASTSSFGSVRNSGTMTILNSIIAENFRGQGALLGTDLTDTGTGSLTSLGHNLIGINSGVTTEFPAGIPNLSGDWVGTDGEPLAPLLLPPGDYGGPTHTVLPMPNSFAVDNGSCPGQTTDQRGFGNAITGFRPVDQPTVTNTDDGCDIGAVELGANPPPIFADGFETGDLSLWAL